MSRSQHILGVWDTNISPIKIGDFLIMLEELHILMQLHKCQKIDIALIYSNKNSANIKHIRDIIKVVKHLKKFYLLDSMKKALDLINNKIFIVWPDFTKSKIKVEYGNTLFIQKYYNKHQSIPYLCFNDVLLKWTDKFFKKYVYPYKCVVVHLKYNSNCTNCSNADFEAWYSFFKKCLTAYENIKFVLVGNEKISQKISNLANVILSRNMESNLVRDLSLIQKSFLFLGTSSGPSNIALFSKVPYIIFKDPRHHKKQMLKELGNKNRYLFAYKNQLFLRENQNADKIFRHFSKIYKKII